MIDLAEIKEVRVGKNSRDFDKWPDDTKLKETKCFVVFYGSEFKLRSLSIAGRIGNLNFQIFLNFTLYSFKPYQRKKALCGLKV